MNSVNFAGTITDTLEEENGFFLRPFRCQVVIPIIPNTNIIQHTQDLRPGDAVVVAGKWEEDDNGPFVRAHFVANAEPENV